MNDGEKFPMVGCFMLWEELLRQLEQLPDDAKQWDEVERYLDRALAHLRARRQRLEERGRLQELLQRLADEYGEDLRYFQFDRALGWIGSERLAKQPAAAIEALQDLLERLQAYRMHRSSVPKTMSESRRQRDELTVLEETITSLYERLDAIFGPGIDEGATTVPAVESTSTAEEPSGFGGVSSSSEVQTVESTSTAEEPREPSGSLITPESPAAGRTDESLEPPTSTREPLPEEEGRSEPATVSSETEERVSPIAPEYVQPAPPEYRFSAADSSTEIARALLQLKASVRVPFLPNLIWRLIGEGRWGFAYYLAQWLNASDQGCWPYVPAWLIRACVNGLHVKSAYGTMATLLKEDFSYLSKGLVSGGDSDWGEAVGYLLAAASLRPALLAPATGASSVLHGLHTSQGLDQLYDYCRRVAEYGDLGHPLDPTTLKQIKTRAAWQRELDELYGEVEAWYQRALGMTMVYAPASKVWRLWLKSNGLIYNLLKPLRQKDGSQKDAVLQEADRLSDPAVVAREVQRLDRQLRQRRKDDITAKALGQLQSRTREAVNFVRRWVMLLQSDPSIQRRFVQKHVDELRMHLAPRHGKVLEELDCFVVQAKSPMVLAALSVLRKAVESVRALFDPAEPFDPDEPDLRQFLQWDLLRVGGIRLDAQWEPHSLNDEVVAQIVEYLADGERSWRDAFDRYCQALDHEGTLRVIGVLETIAPATSETDRLRQRRDAEVEQCRQALSRDIENTRFQIEEAVALGLLREQERIGFSRIVDAVEIAATDALYFPDLHRHLREVRDRIAAQEKQAEQEVTRRLRESGLTVNHPAYVRIENAIRERDYFTAHEYIDMALRGDELPGVEERREVLREFLDCFSAIENYLIAAEARASGLNRIMDDIQSNRDLGPVTLQRVPGAQKKEAARMVRTWFSAKNDYGITHDAIKTILECLGMPVVRLEKNGSANRLWFDVHTERIADRDFCPVPGYGSQANGRYRLLCVWNRPAEEEILRMVRALGHTAPVVVFHFGRMSLQRRRDLARLCHERRQSCLVIDDVLVLFLCGERGSRLPVLFECGLPFTHQDPYTTAAGLVPPEMFYGRRQEADSIVAPGGTCFIYGGRQLGKTALLRRVEQTYHDPKRGWIVVWLDLKTEGIGTGRTLDAIWTLLAHRFKEVGVLDAQTPANIRPERLLELLEAWLRGHSERRILLLLDEADHFLESDGEETSPGPFHRVAMLKGLMDRTQRRFKVVFAGLHDVQRTSRQVNQPLAPGHTGDPVCIGPLLSRGEWREARALIERPLATIGYRFESPDLVTRILSQTNYYPNLIQLYCKYLLDSLQRRHITSFDARHSPPYTITASHIESVSRNPELRRAIRDRFDLTLNLDRRYRVIALVIAMYSQGSPEEATEGFSVSWVRDQVLTYWPRGFRNSSTEDALRVLLDEMVGLGVLVKTGQDRYGLRSPNLVLLTGTVEQIEADLLSCDTWPDPIEYNPGTFRPVRRDASGKTDPTRRSPLTAEQESVLRQRDNGVVVLCGCAAAQLDEVANFLEAACGQEFFQLWSRVRDVHGLRTHLEKLRSRVKDGVTVVLIPADSPWEPSWIRQAQTRVKRLHSQQSFARIVFLADPEKVWRFVDTWHNPFEELLQDGVRKLSLAPWHTATVQQWLDECGFGASAQEKLDEVMSVTGGWPAVLERFLQTTAPDRNNWRAGLEGTHRELMATEWKTHWQEAFGLNVVPYPELLSGWAQLGPATVPELAEVLEASATQVQQVVRWAEILNLATAVGNDQWELVPVVTRIVLG
ncbi:MAG: hypothetical protein KatS3mg110_3222 [Pirellulaceae bacterium]|nr:MAG: hypothetical protein KatS3mg110_3222 [Pirellulaceae bacterium]